MCVPKVAVAWIQLLSEDAHVDDEADSVETGQND